MVTLTKLYKVIYKDSKLAFNLTQNGDSGIVYPGNGCEYAEFDTYEEAKAFVAENNLVYEEPNVVVE